MTTETICNYYLRITKRGLDSNTTDKLMALPGGRNYIALYTLLYNRVYGEFAPWPPKDDILIPFDSVKISREIPVFSLRVVSEALKAFKSLGFTEETRRDDEGGAGNGRVTGDERAFVKPTLMELRQFVSENHYLTKPEDFIDYYEARNWNTCRGKMKDWRVAISSFERSEKLKLCYDRNLS